MPLCTTITVDTDQSAATRRLFTSGDTATTRSTSAIGRATRMWRSAGPPCQTFAVGTRCTSGAGDEGGREAVCDDAVGAGLRNDRLQMHRGPRERGAHFVVGTIDVPHERMDSLDLLSTLRDHGDLNALLGPTVAHGHDVSLHPAHPQGVDDEHQPAGAWQLGLQHRVEAARLRGNCLSPSAAV